MSEADDDQVLINRVLNKDDGAAIPSNATALVLKVSKAIESFIKDNQDNISNSDLPALENLQVLVHMLEVRSGLGRDTTTSLEKTLKKAVKLVKSLTAKNYEIKESSDFTEVTHLKHTRLPAPPKPAAPIKWKKTDSKVDFLTRGQPAVECNAFMRMLAFLPEGDFKRAVLEAGNKDRNIFAISIINLTHPYGYMPNRAALQKMALQYYDKYDILIRETILGDLEKVVDEIEQTMENSEFGPQFVGIIVAQDDDYGDYVHALPLICYFGDKDSTTGIRTKQFLIADTVGRSLLSLRVEDRLLKPVGVEIFKATNVRQVDTFSCRTGGMQLLKRALIALQDNPSGGLKGYLMEYATFQKDNIHLVVHLPPTFDASEQVSNKREDMVETIDSRDRHSKQVGKRSRPRTVKKLRKDHQERIECEYNFSANQLYLLPDVSIPRNVVIERPKEYSENYAIVTVRGTMLINTHLSMKGEILSQG